MKHTLFTLVIFCLFLSCKDNQIADNIFENDLGFLDTNYCDNQINLFIANDTIPVVNIDLSKSMDSCFDQVQQYFDLDTKSNRIYYAINYDLKFKCLDSNINSIPIKIKFHNELVLHEGYRNTNIVILVNKNADLLVENELVSYDSLAHKIRNYFFNQISSESKDEQCHMALMWDNLVSTEKLEEIIYNIIDGYLLAVEEYSINKFNKGICDLNKQEMLVVMSDLPFEFELAFNGIIGLLPPPPKE